MLRAAAALAAAAVGLVLLTLGVLDSRVAGGSIVVTNGTTSTGTTAAAASANLQSSIREVVAASGGRASVAVVDLSSGHATTFGYADHDPYTAASTYKLPALMAEAERVAAGKASPNDSLCFRSSEQEDGWFDDYSDGDCLTLEEVATRAGVYSDNTAGHMLVDDLGGPGALNAYARAHGARESAFFDPNQTTAADLAALWTAEAEGQAGGAAAQRWLYPILTHTRYEDGIPAGVPSTATVVHKVGFIDQTVNDSGLVTAGGTRYAVAITTDGLGGDAGWALIARISALVWKQETAH